MKNLLKRSITEQFYAYCLRMYNYCHEWHSMLYQKEIQNQVPSGNQKGKTIGVDLIDIHTHYSYGDWEKRIND